MYFEYWTAEDRKQHELILNHGLERFTRVHDFASLKSFLQKAFDIDVQIIIHLLM